MKKHAANDLGSSGLENSILLVDAGEEGVTKSEHHQLNNYNHGRDEQGLGSHRPYAGSTLAGETDRTRVVAIRFQKYSSREVALEASRFFDRYF